MLAIAKFFSRNFTSAQQKYSTYDREPTAVCEAIKHFKYLLEGREFKTFTDHKLLIYALGQNSDRASSRQIRQLSFIAQFATQICHIPGSNNVVADALSRADALRLPTQFSLNEFSAEQNADKQLATLLQDSDPILQLKKLTWGPEHIPIYCNINEDSICPYVPLSMRQRDFDLCHAPSHPSSRITDRLIRQRYVWPDMHRDIARWCKACLDCQQSKISRHVKLIPAAFVAPDGRFTHVHIDLVGPLPPSEGSRYCLTMIDRFSRWPEVVPLADISAETVARAFYDQWISRYGAPVYITSDQGSQFESQLFLALLSLLGCERIRTTAYHPAANGLVERWHRDFKAAIMCHAKDWTRVLSTVLLGLRIRIRLDTNASPSEFVYGSALRLPGEFFLLGDFKPNPRYFLEDFREYSKEIRPVPAAHPNKTRAFVYKDLTSCTHVFMLAKAKKSLERPHAGPHKVLQRISDRVYSINVNGEPRNVELLKPA